MIKWPDHLIKSVGSKRLIPVIGSGVSRNCADANGNRPPLWKDLLLTLKDRVPGPQVRRNQIQSLITNKEYLLACEACKHYISNTEFLEIIAEQLVTPGFRASEEWFDAIIGLDARVLISLNYEHLYENYANRVMENTLVVKNYRDRDLGAILRSDSPAILKMHGTVNDLPHIIFSRSDYAKARIENGAFYNLIRSLLMTNTLLFIGCGLSDPDVRILLEDYAFNYPFTRPHYFAVPKGAVHNHVQPPIESSMNISLLEYSPADGHAELRQSLVALGGGRPTEQMPVENAGN